MNILIAEVEGWVPKHIDPSDEPEQLQEVFAKKVRTKGDHFVPLNTSMGYRTQLPYKLDAAEGTYYANNWTQPYSFTALAVKGVSLDLDRFYKEFEEIALRDYSMFKKLFEAHKDECTEAEKIKKMVSYRLVEYHGDESRYNGSEQEVLSNLFYWHLGNRFAGSAVYGLKKRVHIGQNAYGENRVEETIKAGRAVQEILSNVEDEQWVILFQTSTDSC